MTQYPLTPSPHNNQQLFSDHYLDVLLPQRQDWQMLVTEAQPIMEEIATIFKKYKRTRKEAQAEYRFVRPVLELLGHTFEVQPSLATPEGPKQPDYIFYHDRNVLDEYEGKQLTKAILQPVAFAIGDAKSWDRPLDIALQGTRSDLFTNKNPSYQIAFYMRHSGLQWGILTNGRLWRLYHKDTAEMLDHFYEVDLPELLISGNVEQFLYFYAFFHRAAFDQQPLGVAAILKESVDYAQNVGESLKKQVYEALRQVAQAFLDYTPNSLNPDDPATLKAVYDSSLILLYRLLFILYAEARQLLPLSGSEMYRESYSLYSITHEITESLRKGKKLLPDTLRLWTFLKQLFDHINKGEPKLQIATFNGGLFDPEHHKFLEQHKPGDARLQQAIDLLARVDGQFIDYRDLSVRHLGTIYESLLEFHLEKRETSDGWDIDLLNSRGERHATGSYYTPDYIVKYIVDQALGPGLRAAIEQEADEKARIDAVLAIKILDPAMGSGHFLVEATEYIARFLVELNVQPAGTTRESELAYWKRRVVQSCIYGVDLNPLAVELAKLSLWLSTVAKDRPLSFLDHHLRTGNALIGARLADLTIVLNGNGNGNGNGGKQRKAKKPETSKGQLSLFDDDVFRQNITTAVDLMWLVNENPAQTLEQVKEQEQLYAMMRKGLIDKYGKLADLVTATYYGLSIDPRLWKPLIDFLTDRAPIAPVQFTEWRDMASAIATQRRFFHWELEFPEIFFDKYGQPKGTQAGFDVVIGNPPWIRQEAFSEDKVALERLFSVYHGVADLSTYFVELGNTYLTEHGHFGFIIPNKFVRANYGAALRNFLMKQVRLERLVDFGDLPVFHDATTYPLIVLASKESPENEQIKHTLLKRINPDTIAADVERGESVLPPLTDSHWVLADEQVQALLEKMRTVSVPLGEYVGDTVFYGIKTGLNQAFVIDQHTRDKLIADDPKSAEIIKPFVIGKDIKRYKIEYERRYLIFTKQGIDLTRYKAIEQHLSQFISNPVDPCIFVS
jgi:type I restriction-modification system DNA methylase subunit